MSFSLIEGMSEKGKKAVIAAVVDNMSPVESYFPTQMSATEHEAFQKAEREHAPNVAVRMNPVTFKVEYYNEVTGELVSSHI